MDCFIVGQFRKRNTRAYEFQKGPANQKSFGCIAATHKNLSGKDAAATKMAAKGTCVMALMTGEQYVESMRKLNLQVYMFGKKIENPVDDPILRPSLNSVKATYDLAQDPDHEPAVLFLFIDLIRDKRDQPTLLCIKLDRIKHTLKYDLGIKRPADIV